MKSLFQTLLATVVTAASVSITDIQGPAYLSPLNGQTVNTTGIVTGKASNGFYISGNATLDIRRSKGLFVFSTSSTVRSKVNVGDLISLTGKVAEFRSSSDVNPIFATELDSPTNIVVLSTNNTVNPVIIGKDRSPPTQFLNALDTGADGWLSVPNNQTQVDTKNLTLNPAVYGMDFWSSLEGQLVTIPKPVAIDFPNSFGEFWVHGDWKVTGKNSRGGITITFGEDGIPDANPETVIIGSALDDTTNPNVAVGTTLTDITGIVQYQFGFYYVLPLTAPTILTSPSATVPPTTLVSTKSESCILTIGDYNIDNMAPNSTTLPIIADHIATHLKTPDIMFLQEVQDNSGSTDDGVVDATVTLTNIVNSIQNFSGVLYDFVEISPVNDQDGGEPGGNIRQAYLYKSDKLTLVSGTAGNATDAVIASNSKGKPVLNFNPGRIDPANAAWLSSRKPLVAHWKTSGGSDLFTINLHLTSKDGSSSTQSDARPPINLGVDQRTSQVETVATFVESLLAINKNTNIVVGGDCNEYIQTRTAFAAFDSILHEVDELADLPDVERYTYVFDQNNEQLDHLFVSSHIAEKKVQVEHVHVNNWGLDINTRASDHDPTVAKICLC